LIVYIWLNDLTVFLYLLLLHSKANISWLALESKSAKLSKYRRFLQKYWYWV